MPRVLSALALLPVVVGTIWYLPAVWTLVLAAGVPASVHAACGRRPQYKP